MPFDPQPHLPVDAERQKYVQCSAIAAGSIWLPDRGVFEDSIDCDVDVGRRVPSLCFLIEHEDHGKLLFDLGLRKHGLGYPPALESDLGMFAIDCEQDAADLLQQEGIKPEDVSTIVYSHLHFDHVGDLSLFPSAQLLLGEDSRDLMKFVYPDNPESIRLGFPSHQKVIYVGFNEKNGCSQLEPPYTSPSATFHSAPVSTIGAFSRGLDLFSDGSLYLLDAPGHIPGHMVLLARIAPNSFVLLAADCCHNRLCYDPGLRLVSRESHTDIAVARDTVNKLKLMHGLDNVVVILAHESERQEEMPMFPSSLNDWATKEITKKTSK
ncbi:metallo-beta-lactamase superfamily protein [Moniliophthora roreri MCA 2997]|uniref:Metallo-beta-lactamase superfamily protein n=1 Tax=Moniliophthora roreri (strain MCA 2997) TaxID=1381753 RepID=V2XI25_MONRO|nr:metallo-beta-lactamase superfamily protein [Moniliophthora roreri MCA 2997]